MESNFKVGDRVKIKNNLSNVLIGRIGTVIEAYKDNELVKVKIDNFDRYMSKTDGHIIYITNLELDTLDYIKRLKNESK